MEARIAAGLSKRWNPTSATSCLDSLDSVGKSMGVIRVSEVRPEREGSGEHHLVEEVVTGGGGGGVEVVELRGCLEM